MVCCIYRGVTGYNFPYKVVVLSLKTVFVMANRVDPGKMPHYATFHLGIFCLSKYVLLTSIFTEYCKFRNFRENHLRSFAKL